QRHDPSGIPRERRPHTPAGRDVPECVGSPPPGRRPAPMGGSCAGWHAGPMLTNAITRRLSFANVMSALALFTALGGASYAAIKVPSNSVGTKQIRNRAITTRKLDRRLLTSLRGTRGL